MKPKMPNLRRINPLSASLTGALVLIGATGPALAVGNTYYWTIATQGSGTPNNYGTAASWSTNPVSGGSGASPGSADIAIFSQSAKYGNTNSRLGADKALAGLEFYNTGSTALTTNTTTQRTLTIGSGGIYMDGGAGAVTISTGGLPVAVAVNATQSWTNNSSNAITLGGGATKSLSPSAASTVTLNGNFIFAAPIVTGTGTLTITQTGGTVIYSAANTYTGATNINGGTLQVDGSTASASTVTVNSSGTLSGTGTINGAAVLNGILSPGDAANTSARLAAATLNLKSSSTFADQLNSNSISTANLQVVTTSGGLTLDASNGAYLSLSDLGATQLAAGTVVSLVNYAGTLNGGYFTLAGPNTLLTPNSTFTLGANTWQITYADTTGGSNAAGLSGHFINLTTLTAVPEPGSLLALGCLVGSGAMLRSRRRR